MKNENFKIKQRRYVERSRREVESIKKSSANTKYKGKYCFDCMFSLPRQMSNSSVAEADKNCASIIQTSSEKVRTKKVLEKPVIVLTFEEDELKQKKIVLQSFRSVPKKFAQ